MAERPLGPNETSSIYLPVHLHGQKIQTNTHKSFFCFLFFLIPREGSLMEGAQGKVAAPHDL